MKLGFGIVLALFGALLLLVGVGMFFDPLPDAKPSDGGIAGACGGIITLPGIFLLVLHFKERKLHRRREELLGYLKSRRRIRLNETAADFQVSPAAMMRELGQLIANRATDLVHLEDTREYLHRADYDLRKPIGGVRCQSCGAASPAG